MKISILGYGEQGRSAYDYWRAGNDITICDGNEQLNLPPGITSQLGPDHLQNLDRFDLIVRSPSVHPREIVAANSPTTLEKVTTNTNEFFRVCPTKHIIGVTGTKGKGTTSTLITKMLEAAGQRVHLGGNIGTPPLDLLKDGIQPADWVVLELANFQLIDLHYSPHIAVCLMIAPEHQDWHESVEEYYQAKTQLFAHQRAADSAIYYATNSDSQAIAARGAGQKLPYYARPGALVDNDSISISGQTICRTDELQLLGKHNWQNACAALTAVWQITQDVTAIRSVLTSFSGLEHRLELVREFDGVRYYDDSFATTPEASTVAIEAFTEPKVVILGGSDKGADYHGLAETINASTIRKILLIGEQATRIQQALESAGFHNFIAGGGNAFEIVANARRLAAPGDVVLLSTACASFDMFANYKDRGEQFSRAVQALVSAGQ